MGDLFTLRSQCLPEDTRVVGFRGTEALSRLYEIEIFLQIAGPDAHSFEVADAVGGKASLVASREDEREPFVFAGIFSEVALVHETEDRALVRAILVPRLWGLSQSLHSRIFTQRSIPDILAAVLDENAFGSGDYELRLTGQYKPEEHVCQYGESDLDFLSRWMEREGLYYFFEHAEDGEKLVIADNTSAHRDLPASAIRYFPEGGQDVGSREHLETFVCRHRRLPGSVRFKDYDYAKPTLDVSSSAPVSKNGVGEIHLHGARVFTPDGAKRLSAIRAEQLRARERVFTGSGTALYLRSGATFDLIEHPRTAFDRKYLAIEVEHQGNQLAGSADLRRLTGLDTDDVYRAHVTAIPADTQFRAEEATTWPRIYGTEHGVIDGEADSEYAQIDEHGRYLVRFAFDESDLKAGKASTWVRMMQPHGGGVEGWHFPLRKGTEVLFTFLGGDPDRPVIAGVVPNALKPSPVTRANHTKNVIQTGGRNRIEMDDKVEHQFIAHKSPHGETRQHLGYQPPIDLPVPPQNPPGSDGEVTFELTYALSTKGSGAVQVGGDWWQQTGGSYYFSVDGDSRVRHKGEYTLIVGGTAIELYGAHRKRTVNGLYEQFANAGQNETVLGPWNRQATGPVKDTVNGTLDETVNGPVTTTIVGSWNQTVTGGIQQTIKGPVTHTKTDSHWGITLGAAFDGYIGLKTGAFIGGKADLTVAASLSAKLSTELSLVVGESVSLKAANELSLTSGARFSATQGLDIKLNSSIGVTITPTWVKETNTELAKAVTNVVSAAAFIVS